MRGRGRQQWRASKTGVSAGVFGVSFFIFFQKRNTKYTPERAPKPVSFFAASFGGCAQPCTKHSAVLNIYFILINIIMSRNSAGRSTSYSPAEVEVLLDLVEEILPLGSERWERLGNEFHQR